MKPAHHLLLAAVLITGGVLLGRGIVGRQDPAPAPAEDPAAAPLRQSPAGKPDPASAEEGPRDLKGLRARYQKWIATGSGQRRELERLSVPALRELILTQLAEIGNSARTQETAARHSVMNGALAELYRREGIAAIEWVAGLETGNARKQAMGAILRIALRENPESAKPWLDRFEEDYGKDILSGGYINEAMTGAISRGADDVIKVHQLFGSAATRTGLSGMGGSFPEGFDFAKLHTALGGQLDMTNVVKHWAARDADAAWQAVKGDVAKRGQPASRTFGALVTGLIAREGETAALEWSIARLDELSPEQRKLCVQEIDGQGRLTVEGITTAVELLPPADRKELAGRMIGQYRANEKAFVALGALTRDDLMATLEAGARKHQAILNGPGNDEHHTSLRRLYQDAETRFSLTPEESARLHAAKAKAP